MTTKDQNPARYISRFLALRIVVKPAYTKEVDGRVVTVQGKDIRFVEGVFETTDQELIDFLEADKSFGTTYIRVPDNVLNASAERAEWAKDLEARERDIAIREAALKEKESKVNASEEGGRVTDGLDGLKKADLLDIASKEEVEGVNKDTKNADIITAIRAKREAGNTSGKPTGSEDGAQF